MVFLKKEELVMSSTQYMPILDIDSFNHMSSKSEQKNAIKIALMMVKGFRDILDDLNFDEDGLRELQFSLDDSYDDIEEIYKKITDKETKEIIDELLTNIAKLDMEIADTILEYKNAS